MDQRKCWGEKPYYSLDYNMKRRFGEKVYKLALDGGMTCPNRDGTLDSRGCIFCSGNGSGDFASPQTTSIKAQIDTGIAGLSSRKAVGKKFIAYFQSFTNTYAPLNVLKRKYQEAIMHEQVIMLSVATRPDCLPLDILDLLAECNQIKPVIVELGLQTIHERTVSFIRRGYSLPVFEKALKDLKDRDIEVVVHVIAGLPFETKKNFLDTIRYLSHQPIDGIKLQLLHVLKDTDLTDYLSKENEPPNKFRCLTQLEYIEWISEAITLLPENIVIHRLTGDGPKELLIAPSWSSRKRDTLNQLHKSMKEHDMWQGQKKEVFYDK